MEHGERDNWLFSAVDGCHMPIQKAMVGAVTGGAADVLVTAAASMMRMTSLVCPLRENLQRLLGISLLERSGCATTSPSRPSRHCRRGSPESV